MRGLQTNSDTVKKSFVPVARPDASFEFFSMNLLSIILKHKKRNQLIALRFADGTDLRSRLFSKAENVPFYEYHDWITQQIDKEIQSKLI